MRAASLLLILLCWGQDDPRVEWIKKNAVAVKSIDPADTDFKDLEPLRDMIGKARIVQLGEQTHGDGAAFLAKIRLIKFLHEKMGFDVIAWESGLFDCRKAWEKFKAGADPVEAAQTGILGIWTQSEEVRPLFKYLAERAKTEKPLELCGFDCQFTARGSTDSLLPDLEAALGKVKPEARKAIELLLKPDAKPKAEERTQAIEALKVLRASLESPEVAQALGEEAPFWSQMGESLVAQAESLWANKGRGVESVNIRDGQMAKNLIWLAEKRYPGRKIIVWAATFHIMRNPAAIEAKTMSYEKAVTMGHRVSEKFGDEVFTLGFTAYEGRAGNPFGRSYPLAKPPAGSLEDLCAKAGLENAVINFRLGKEKPAWFGEKFTALPLGYQLMKADWSEVVDGMVFTRRMTPSTRAESAPAPMSPEETAKARDLLGTLDTLWQLALKRRADKNAWEHKVAFMGEFDRWKRAANPDAAAIAAMEKSVAEWREKHKDEAGSDWRSCQLLADFAADRKDVEAAANLLDRALAAYPDVETADPRKLSSFQHLVNQRALLVWDSKGFEAALEYAAGLLAKEKKFSFFYLDPWNIRLNREKKADAIDKAIKRIKAAYDARAKAFPDLAGQIDSFKGSLK